MSRGLADHSRKDPVVDDEQKTGITDEDVEAHQKSRDALDEGDDDVEAHQKSRDALDEGDAPDVEGHLKSKD
jgi:hypothetical protein